jgi:hypothetical protein
VASSPIDKSAALEPRVKSLTELNAWLEDQCIAYGARAIGANEMMMRPLRRK